jgi:hypothetical protein
MSQYVAKSEHDPENKQKNRAIYRLFRTFDDVGRASPGSVVAAPL